VQDVVRLEQIAGGWQVLGRSRPAGETSEPGGQRFAALVELPPELKALPGSEANAVFLVPSTTLANLLQSWLQANLRLLGD
jgi:hypothetical protein